MKKKRVSEVPGLLEQVRRDALGAILSLTEEDSADYYNCVYISSEMRAKDAGREKRRLYGDVTAADVPGLLDGFIDCGYVLKVRIKSPHYHSPHGNPYTTGYRANLERREEIEGLLNAKQT